MGRKVDARLPEKRGYPGAVGCSGQGAARCTVPPMVTHTRVPHVHLSAHALPSPCRSRAMTSSQYTPPAQGNPAQRGAPQPGRAVRQPRVLPSPPRPPRRSTQAPARRQPAGSRSNYQLGWEPGPCASTTAPHLNSVGPRSGGVGAAACRGDTAGPPPPTAAPNEPQLRLITAQWWFPSSQLSTAHAAPRGPAAPPASTCTARLSTTERPSVP